MSMFTTQDPTHCPKCQSKNICLGQKIYKKDMCGEGTDTVILGMWFCNGCGNVLGRKMSQYENDVDPDCI